MYVPPAINPCVNAAGLLIALLMDVTHTTAMCCSDATLSRYV